jgi:hypothetical protein
LIFRSDHAANRFCVPASILHPGKVYAGRMYEPLFEQSQGIAAGSL